MRTTRTARHSVPILGAVLAMLVVLAAAPSAADAQAKGSIAGSVTSDSSGAHGIGSVEVFLPALNFAVRTNWMGDFRIDGVPPGGYLVTARLVGYRAMSDSVTVQSGAVASAEFVLGEKVVVLDSVVAHAAAPSQYLSPNLRAFDERRQSHSGGYFVTDSVLRLNDSNWLSDVLVTHTPGMRMEHGAEDSEYAVSTRDPKQGQFVFLKSQNISPRSTDGTLLPPRCYVTIYVDGIMVYDMAQMPNGPVPNLRDYSVNQFTAIEFYPGQAAMPEQFSSPSGCGALLLWTREK